MKIPSWIKGIGIGLATLLVVGMVVVIILHEPKPVLRPTAEADRIAEEVRATLGGDAWDSVRVVRWSFMDVHQYVWYKRDNKVEVRWSDIVVDVHTKTLTGEAYKRGHRVEGRKSDKLVQKAWKYFCNDSFWLIAPFKLFDPGTKRGLVSTDDGRQGLMVTYTSGGVTPGDTYLWLLNEDHMPTGWKMWVQILPVGGIEVSWHNWTKFQGGVWVSTKKSAGPFELNITDVSIEY